MKKLRACLVLLVTVFVTFASSATPGDAAAQPAKVCVPAAVAREDFLISTISTLPGYPGLPAYLDVRSVVPIHGDKHPMGGDVDEKCRTTPRRAVILVHGAMTEGTTSFDLRFGDYSLMQGLAEAGIHAYAVNLLGYGLSTRFGLNDPCNASLANQQRLLIPNPLSQPCVSPDDFRFTNTAATVDQLDAVVDEVRARADVDEVSLFGWSRGAVVIGAYAGVHPEKIRSLAFLASGYDFPSEAPAQVPGPGPSLLVRDRAGMFNEWTPQLDTLNCPGQRNPAILDPIWGAVRARDPLGSSWGSTDTRVGGVQRAPSWDVWGWNQERASAITLPSLVITGLLDRTNPSEREVRLFNDLASGNKVLIQIACASHQALWEGTTTPGWGGPHESIRTALVEWITSKTFQDSHRGSFQISSTGSISGE